MRVGITTYCGAQNYGALLQAQALTDYIASLGNDCCLLNIFPFDARWFKPRKTIQDISMSVLKIGEGKKRIQRYVSYKDRYLCFSDKAESLQEQEKLNEQFDCFVTGSDQVWNCNGKVNDTFFLRFAQNGKNKVAYAPSFGSAHIPGECRGKVQAYLKDIDHISVREKSGADIVEELTGIRPPVVVDPVFLKKPDDWKEIAAKIEIKKPYAFVYTTQTSENLNKAVKQYIDKTGNMVVTTHAIPGCHCRVHKDIGPLEFLGYLLNAEYVISTSFHATAFSIIFKRNFCVVPHSSTGARVTDLLEDANLSQCIWSDGFTYRKVNFNGTGLDALDSRIESSKEYLRKSLRC